MFYGNTYHLLSKENGGRGIVDLVLIILPDRNDDCQGRLLVEMLLARRVDPPLHHLLTLGKGSVHVANVEGGAGAFLVNLARFQFQTF